MTEFLLLLILIALCGGGPFLVHLFVVYFVFTGLYELRRWLVAFVILFVVILLIVVITGAGEDKQYPPNTEFIGDQPVLTCPSCGEKFTFWSSDRGEMMTCPYCRNAQVRVP
jgi:hypothetical protein